MAALPAASSKRLRAATPQVNNARREEKRLRIATIVIALCAAGAAIAAEPWREGSGALGRAKPPVGTLGKADLDALVEAGEKLFSAKFTEAEGVGRPAATQAILPTKARRRPRSLFARTHGMDGSACASCHNEPKLGGAGDFVTNVFVSEGFASADFDTTDPQFSNERGTNHLFGAGLVELLAREMSAELAAIRSDALRKAVASGDSVTVPLEAKGVAFGSITADPHGFVDTSRIDGVDIDLVVRPFTHKGVMTGLRQFTVNAMNHHHGIQADERFAARWTGEDDHDEDGVANEMGAADVSALVAWQATLPPPTERTVEGEWKRLASKGRGLMDEWQCTACHRPALPLDSLRFSDPGPLDASGTLAASDGDAATYDLALRGWAKGLPRDEEGRVLVPLWGDLKRHVMVDRRNQALGNEILSQRFVDRTIFATTELWGVASTAPYGHRNDFSSLDAIIRAHGGAGAEAKDRYEKGTDRQREALIAFLKTLVIE